VRVDVSRDATCGHDEEKEKGQTFMRQLAICQTTHVDIAPKFCMYGRVRDSRGSYISSFMKIGFGVSELWGSKTATSH